MYDRPFVRISYLTLKLNFVEAFSRPLRLRDTPVSNISIRFILFMPAAPLLYFFSSSTFIVAANGCNQNKCGRHFQSIKSRGNGIGVIGRMGITKILISRFFFTVLCKRHQKRNKRFWHNRNRLCYLYLIIAI